MVAPYNVSIRPIKDQNATLQAPTPDDILRNKLNVIFGGNTELGRRAVNYLGSDLEKFGNNVRDSGVLGGFLQGASRIPQALGGLAVNATNQGLAGLDPTEGNKIVGALNSLPGLAGTLVGGETGRNLVESADQALMRWLGLGGGTGAGTQTAPPAINPQDAPVARVPEADPLAGLQGKSFYDPLQMPELAALRTGKAPDFEAARAALGPEVQAQQIGQNEALNAAFGGGAAGGLQAIQNAKPGTAASLGEVIAGAGAGIAQEVRRIHSENRELEELARANEGLRKRQLSSIALAEEAKKAEMSEIEAQAFNQRELTKAQMQIQISDANNRNRRPIPVTGGLFFPDTGEFMRTETETPMEILQGFLLVNEFLKSTTERTGVALGQGVMLDNLSPIVQGPVMHSIQAMNNPNIVPMFIEALEEQGREDFAANVERLFAGTPGTDSKADAALASQAVSAMAYMFLENNANPTDPPYPFLLEYQTDNFGLPGVQNTTDALSALGGLGIR